MIKTISIGIEQQTINSFPRIVVGGFLAKGLGKAANRLGEDAEQMRAARGALLEEGLSLENLVNDPRICGWREAFMRMGLKPSTFKSSAEQLARRLLKGDLIRTPLPVVNLYCAISAKHVCPMGGYDLARLPERQVTVRFARPESDRFTPLGGQAESMPLSPYVAVYACGSEIICWGFNHRDSRMTCLSTETQDAVFFAESVTEAQLPSIKKALGELRDRLAVAGAEVGEVGFAAYNTPQALLTF